MTRRYPIVLLTLLSINFGLVFLDRNALNYVMPFVAPELGIDERGIGLLAGATALSWAVSGLVFSALSDRIGARKAILVGATVLFSTLSVASGFATGFASLLAVRLLMGAAEGPVLPLSQAMVAAEAPPERRGLYMGIMNNFGSNLLGVMIAPPLLVGIAQAAGWRASFWIAGVPGLIMAALILVLVRDPAPRSAGAATTPDDGAAVSWRMRNLALCTAIACCMLAWTLLGWVFLPVYFVRAAGFSPATMGLLMSVLGASAVVSCVAVPGLSDRIGRRAAMVIFGALGTVAPLAAGFSGLDAGPLAVALFLGWMASGTLPLFMATIPAESTPARQLATAMAVVMGVGEVVGGAVMPVVAGQAAATHGLIAVIVIQAGCAAVAAALSLFLVETAPRAIARG